MTAACWGVAVRDIDLGSLASLLQLVHGGRDRPLGVRDLPLQPVHLLVELAELVLRRGLERVQEVRQLEQRQLDLVDGVTLRGRAGGQRRSGVRSGARSGAERRLAAPAPSRASCSRSPGSRGRGCCSPSRGRARALGRSASPRPGPLRPRRLPEGALQSRRPLKASGALQNKHFAALNRSAACSGRAAAAVWRARGRRPPAAARLCYAEF